MLTLLLIVSRKDQSDTDRLQMIRCFSQLIQSIDDIRSLRDDHLRCIRNIIEGGNDNEEYRYARVVSLSEIDAKNAATFCKLQDNGFHAAFIYDATLISYMKDFDRLVRLSNAAKRSFNKLVMEDDAFDRLEALYPIEVDDLTIREQLLELEFSRSREITNLKAYIKEAFERQML